MKNILQPIILLSLLLSGLHAAEPATTYTYRGEVAGVMCSACAKKVKAAIAKLDGVSSVKITLGDQAGLPKLEVVSTSPDLTRDAAVKALGDAAAMYDIRSLKRVDR